MTGTFRSLLRAALLTASVVAANSSFAGSSTTLYFPDFNQYTNFATASFSPLDPAAPAIRGHVTGDWTFYFEHDQNLPASSEVIEFSPELNIFFSGPGGNDGTTGIPISYSRSEAVYDFTGKIDYTIHVDTTFTWLPGGYYANIVGDPNLTSFAYVEDTIGTATPGDMYLTDVEVRGLTLTLTAIPEPTTTSMLLAAAGLIGFVIRRSGYGRSTISPNLLAT